MLLFVILQHINDVVNIIPVKTNDPLYVTGSGLTGIGCKARTLLPTSNNQLLTHLSYQAFMIGQDPFKFLSTISLALVIL